MHEGAGFISGVNMKAGCLSLRNNVSLASKPHFHLRKKLFKCYPMHMTLELNNSGKTYKFLKIKDQDLQASLY